MRARHWSATLAALALVPAASAPPDRLNSLRADWVSHDPYSRDKGARVHRVQSELVTKALTGIGLSDLTDELLSEREFLDELAPHLFQRAMAQRDWKVATALLSTMDPRSLSPFANIETALVDEAEGDDLSQRVGVLLEAFQQSRGKGGREDILGDTIVRAFGPLFDGEFPEKDVLPEEIAERIREQIARGARLLRNADYPIDWWDAMFPAANKIQPIVRFAETAPAPK